MESHSAVCCVVSLTFEAIEWAVRFAVSQLKQEALESRGEGEPQNRFPGALATRLPGSPPGSPPAAQRGIGAQRCCVVDVILSDLIWVVVKRMTSVETKSLPCPELNKIKFSSADIAVSTESSRDSV